MFHQKRAICSAFVPRPKKDNASDNDLFFAAFRKIIKISSPPVTINSSPVLIGKSHFPLVYIEMKPHDVFGFVAIATCCLPTHAVVPLSSPFPLLPPSRLADYRQTSKPPEKINENRTKILWVLEIESKPRRALLISLPPPSLPCPLLGKFMFGICLGRYYVRDEIINAYLKITLLVKNVYDYFIQL